MCILFVCMSCRGPISSFNCKSRFCSSSIRFPNGHCRNCNQISESNCNQKSELNDNYSDRDDNSDLELEPMMNLDMNIVMKQDMKNVMNSEQNSFETKMKVSELA